MVVSNLNGILVKPHNSKELANAWKTVFNFNFKPEFIRNNVIEKFSIQSMADHYEELLFSRKISIKQIEYAKA
jgi:hypothetical protein